MDETKIDKVFHRLLAQEIQRARKIQNITQEALAEKINMSTNNTGEIGRGESRPFGVTLFTLCRALNINSYELFKRVEKEIEKDCNDDKPY